jgi:hypothetical protein
MIANNAAARKRTLQGINQILLAGNRGKGKSRETKWKKKKQPGYDSSRTDKIGKRMRCGLTAYA